MGEVFVVGASSTTRGSGTARLALEAAHTALLDGGVAATEVTAVFVGFGSSGPFPSTETMAVRLGLRRLGLRPRPAGAERAAPGPVEQFGSGPEALHHAFRAIESGVEEIVLCIGADHSGPVRRPWESWPPRAVLRARSRTARRCLESSGVTPAHLARVVVKNRTHGAARGLTSTPVFEEVIDDGVLEWPLTRSMVAMHGHGAAAVVLASARAARRHNRKPARLCASILVAARHEGDSDAALRAARLAYRDASLGPDDLDCAELHDATAAAELAAYEQLGLTPEGHCGELIDSGFTAAGGPLPVNLSGGLLSLGERPGACAIGQVIELTRQLRGEARSSQVPAARAALAHCVGRPADRVGELTVVTLLTI